MRDITMVIFWQRDNRGDWKNVSSLRGLLDRMREIT